MRRIHLLRVDEEARVFSPLIVTAAAAGLRVGWLELAAPGALPEGLSAVLLAGGDRAVEVADGWTLGARPRRGPAVLRELLRQQFLGCALVLVHGRVEAPAVASAPEGRWRITLADGAVRTMAGDELVTALRRPHPFAPAGTGT